MNVRAIIALFMGLVIQLAQVRSCVAATSAEPSAADASPCCCCAGLESCPCVSDRAPDQKPAPLIPAAVDLKWLLPKASATNILAAPPPPRVETGISTASPADARWAYPGVPLSVAFCRFVI